MDGEIRATFVPYVADLHAPTIDEQFIGLQFIRSLPPPSAWYMEPRRQRFEVAYLPNGKITTVREVNPSLPDLDSCPHGELNCSYGSGACDCAR